jgi:hypothetical protein
MSSLAAETVLDLSSNELTPPTSSFALEDVKIPISDIEFGFDESYANKAGPSSAGLEEQGYFDHLPVLEKGSGEGLASVPALAPFVLDESQVAVRVEGGWAGWTCVAGSWLVCEYFCGHD